MYTFTIQGYSEADTGTTLPFIIGEIVEEYEHWRLFQIFVIWSGKEHGENLPYIYSATEHPVLSGQSTGEIVEEYGHWRYFQIFVIRSGKEHGLIGKNLPYTVLQSIQF